MVYDVPGRLDETPSAVRTPHEDVKIIAGGLIACPRCRRLMNLDEYFALSCVKTRRENDGSA
jgi:hypothetical protein